MRKYWALGAVLAVSVGASFVAVADVVTIPDEYGKLIQQHSRIGALDGGFFGDHVSLSTGNLEFVQTDVSLPGNDGLAVRVGRRLQVGRDHWTGHFGDWDLDIPHLHGIFAVPPSFNNWVDEYGGGNRCSQFGPPPGTSSLGGSNGWFDADEYWHGSFLYLPGSGDQELLHALSVPTSGGPYPAATLDGAVARCLDQLASTSEAGSEGEGFEVVTPDGTVYTFDQMVSRSADEISKSSPAPLDSVGGATSSGTSSLSRQKQGLIVSPASASGYNLQRREAILYPTKVTDRFGNTVTYAWSSSNAWRLLHITASDGRHLDFTYSATDPDSYLVQSVTDGTRTWTYTNGGETVLQPDGGVWQNDLHDLSAFAKPSAGASDCDTMGAAGGTWTGSITAPSGATARYTVAGTVFGRSWMARECLMDADGLSGTALEPYLFTSMALVGKTITGPGLPGNGLPGSGLTWSYAYGAPNNCWNPLGSGTPPPNAVMCTGSSPITRTTTVTAPDGTVSRYTFGNKYGENEGKLLTEEDGVSGGTALRTTTTIYAEVAAPYTSLTGQSPRGRGDYVIAGQHRPQRAVTTTQQGRTFSWSVAATCSGIPYCFDTRARPTTVVRSGPNATARTETTTYHDDTGAWVLGQVAQRTINGTVAEQTTFDGNDRPWKIYAFGKLKDTFTYNTDGTLATVADGNNHVTTYGNWKRGIPQSVQFPATTESPSGATRTAAVNDQGWITGVTDENGFATGYAYDALGRITQVTFPAGDSVTWASTTSIFELVASAENGIAGGHWRETVSTGNARKVTLFDALWRPVLVREYDNANVAGTDRYMATAYDRAGRVADSSYPLAAAPTMQADGTWKSGASRPNGVRTGYDALGRPTGTQQDSELGVLTTTTEYLAGFQRRVTDARLHATTETFMAWDIPSFDLPIRIDAPENQTTTITRDIFGKPTSITRGEAQ